MLDPEILPEEWIEFEAGTLRIALHKTSKDSRGSESSCRHKIVFYAKDVAKERAKLLKRKVKMGSVKTWGKLSLCDFSDPEGNRIQLSNRK